VYPPRESNKSIPAMLRRTIGNARTVFLITRREISNPPSSVGVEKIETAKDTEIAARKKARPGPIVPAATDVTSKPMASRATFIRATVESGEMPSESMACLPVTKVDVTNTHLFIL
jgi:hypothetical protein